MQGERRRAGLVGASHREVSGGSSGPSERAKNSINILKGLLHRDCKDIGGGN